MQCKKEEEKRENVVDETTYAKAKATTFFEHAPSLSLFLYIYTFLSSIDFRMIMV